MVKHGIFGVTALAVVALDFVIGGTVMIIAGIIALAASVYSFAAAATLRRSPPLE